LQKTLWARPLTDLRAHRALRLANFRGESIPQEFLDRAALEKGQSGKAALGQGEPGGGNPGRAL
jgi:hypothetical protein